MTHFFGNLTIPPGHYQLPSTILDYAEHLISPVVEKAGMNTDNLRLIDKLVPGLRLQGLGTYWQ